MKLPYCDHIRGNVSNTASPVLGRVVQHVVYTDIGVLSGKCIKVILEQNVLLCDVGENEVDLSLVTGSTATNDGTNNLKHRGDARATRDHAEVADHVGLVDEGTLRTLYADGLTNNEASHELGDISLRVALDQEVKVTWLVVAGDGGVGTDNLLGLAVGLGKEGADGDVLADRKT